MMRARESMTVFQQLQAWAEAQYKGAKVVKIVVELRAADGHPMTLTMRAPEK
jgi:hypothetical protein